MLDWHFSLPTPMLATAHTRDVTSPFCQAPHCLSMMEKSAAPLVLLLALGVSRDSCVTNQALAGTPIDGFAASPCSTRTAAVAPMKRSRQAKLHSADRTDLHLIWLPTSVSRMYERAGEVVWLQSQHPPPCQTANEYMAFSPPAWLRQLPAQLQSARTKMIE